MVHIFCIFKCKPICENLLEYLSDKDLINLSELIISLFRANIEIVNDFLREDSWREKIEIYTNIFIRKRLIFYECGLR